MLFDSRSGIDYIRENNHGLQGIAARVQWGIDFQSFTIRSRRVSGAKTELEKRIKQIKSGYFYPYLTLQAYFDNRQDNNLLSVGVIRTIHLYEFHHSHNHQVFKNKADNDFDIVYWRDIQKVKPMAFTVK